MTTLEKRISVLKSRFDTEQRVLVQLPRSDGTYEPVPAGFQGTVHQVVFVEWPNASKERPHADT